MKNLSLWASPTPPSVPGLVQPAGPFQIAGFITHFVINSFKRKADWLFPHVFKKSSCVFNPRSVHRYASSTVSRIIFAIRVRATLLGFVITPKFGGYFTPLRRAMTRAHSGGKFLFGTTATYCVASAKVISRNSLNPTTITDASPVDSTPNIFSFLRRGKPPKLSACQIYAFHGSGIGHIELRGKSFDAIKDADRA